MYNTNLSASTSREPESHNLFPRPSFSWSMGDTNSRENEPVRVFDRVNVETSMKEMQQQMKRLEGTFFSVTNQLKSAIEGLRPSNSNSQTDSRREREGGSNEKLYETCSRPILSSRELRVVAVVRKSIVIDQL